ncbi:copper resistance CopC family protein [Actinomycetospora termitidis]|uniref:Copper resistance protein CopC n=1 Tax=Actinomycetospora termitidis TaxID=3053470 RepID=A0ABT7MCA3_9PSEU|nr:copper resistance CopC family protein [Actinomycetospora sp. Odt1-22]MDL5157799.1 copper resistance protein CopC [Actinomycetospora sp. Odt1-22]
MTINHAPRRAFLRPALVAVLVGLLTLLGTGPALAHDVLEGSDPADGAQVAAAPSRITLTFGEAPTAGTATITVVGPDGTTHYESGAPTSEGEKISVGVGPLGAAGRYEVGYRVVSSDGHPISGALSFTLTTPGPAAASATPAAAAAPPVTPSPAASAAPAPDEGGGFPAWPFVVLAVVVVIGAVAMVLRRRA